MPQAKKQQTRRREEPSEGVSSMTVPFPGELPEGERVAIVTIGIVRDGSVQVEGQRVEKVSTLAAGWEAAERSLPVESEGRVDG